MRRNAILLTIFTMISKLIGMIRESILSFYYGTSQITDIFFITSSIPNVVFGLISAGLVTTFIPIYSRISHRDGRERADSYLDNILNLIFILALLVTSLGLIFTEELVKFVASGFEGQVLVMAVRFTKVTLFAILGNGVFSVLNGYHQYYNRFLIGTIGGFFVNFIIITSIIISVKTDPIAMAFGIVVASIAQMVFTYTIANKRSGYKLKIGINFNDKYLKQMLIMAGPILIGSSITQINGIIDKRIASTLASGAISTLNYASKISDSIYSLFVVTITTVMYPTLNKQAAKGDFDSLKNTVTKIMIIVVLIVIPSTIGLMILSFPTTKVFFGRGAGGSHLSIERISSTLFFSSLGIIGYGLRMVLIQTFYSLQDSATPVVSGIITVVVNLILNLLLAPKMGVPGLALATSISTILGVIILYYQLFNKIEGIPLFRFLKSFLKISFASLIMGFVVYFSHRFLEVFDFFYIIPLCLAVILGVSSYLFMIHFMDVPEFDDTIKILKKKLKIL